MPKDPITCLYARLCQTKGKTPTTRNSYLSTPAFFPLSAPSKIRCRTPAKTKQHEVDELRQRENEIFKIVSIGLESSKEGTSKKARGTAQQTSRKKAPARTMPVSIPSDEEAIDSDEDARPPSDQEDMDNGQDDDLAGLDAEALKAKLINERAQWSTKAQFRSLNKASQGLPNGFDNGVDVVSAHSAATAAGRGSHEDEPAADVDGPGGDKEEDHSQERSLLLNASKNPSKRELARRAEVPRWNSAEEDNRKRSKGMPTQVDGDDHSDDEEEDTNNNDDSDGGRADHELHNGWSEDASYIPPISGAPSRIISIKLQPRSLRVLIRDCIRQFTGDAHFKTGLYPRVEDLRAIYRSVILTCSQDLGLHAYHLRAQHDDEFVDHIGRILAVRLSKSRSDAKKITSGKVEGFYQLIPGEQCKEDVKHATSTGEYIYPKTTSGSVNKKKPFGHPAMLSSLKDIEQGPGADELEIPAPMLCIVATALHASLDDWSTGHLRKTEFNADEYEDVYRGHELFLKQIWEAKPAAYHRLMADLYAQVSARESHSATTIANNAMALLDLDGMDV
ncbi:hypothetical protein LshimejAT787_0703610 [Lyophyllum shimeji]|uniref:DUF6532 domain-containing protein n=1 Tax=Lyophyllum shimeji TaxID=47721 RepID=A0A9P3UR37_LYOSH|nr:hypothetical protein LshimejAT787_0703610 [Lyophyllum shimeji]